MDILALPFNQLVGLQRAPAGSPYVFTAAGDPKCHNHLGAAHASLQLALAEATSGECLLGALKERRPDAFAVVRRVEAKFRNPLVGQVYSKGSIPPDEVDRILAELAARGRTWTPVSVQVLDAEGTVGLAATFEWFVQVRGARDASPSPGVS
jgi:hypothetical protein